MTNYVLFCNWGKSIFGNWWHISLGRVNKCEFSSVCLISFEFCFDCIIFLFYKWNDRVILLSHKHFLPLKLYAFMLLYFFSYFVGLYSLHVSLCHIVGYIQSVCFFPWNGNKTHPAFDPSFHSLIDLLECRHHCTVPFSTFPKNIFCIVGMHMARS